MHVNLAAHRHGFCSYDAARLATSGLCLNTYGACSAVFWNYLTLLTDNPTVHMRVRALLDAQHCGGDWPIVHTDHCYPR